MIPGFWTDRQEGWIKLFWSQASQPLCNRSTRAAFNIEGILSEVKNKLTCGLEVYLTDGEREGGGHTYKK